MSYQKPRSIRIQRGPGTFLPGWDDLCTKLTVPFMGTVSRIIPYLARILAASDARGDLVHSSGRSTTCTQSLLFPLWKRSEA